MQTCESSPPENDSIPRDVKHDAVCEAFLLSLGGTNQGGTWHMACNSRSGRRLLRGKIESIGLQPTVYHLQLKRTR